MRQQVVTTITGAEVLSRCGLVLGRYSYSCPGWWPLVWC